MKKNILGLLSALLTVASAATGANATISLSVPCSQQANNHYFQEKPRWQYFLKKNAISLLTGITIGAITGIGGAEVNKRWVVQHGVGSDTRWLIAAIGTAVAQWTLNDLAKNALEDADVPYDTSLITWTSFISSCVFYLQRR